MNRSRRWKEGAGGIGCGCGGSGRSRGKTESRGIIVGEATGATIVVVVEETRTRGEPVEAPVGRKSWSDRGGSARRTEDDLPDADHPVAPAPPDEIRRA